MSLAISTKTPVELPALPFTETALEPVISANTLSFHHGKHHKAYVDKALSLIAGTELEGKTLKKLCWRRIKKIKPRCLTMPPRLGTMTSTG